MKTVNLFGNELYAKYSCDVAEENRIRDALRKLPGGAVWKARERAWVVGDTMVAERFFLEDKPAWKFIGDAYAVILKPKEMPAIRIPDASKIDLSKHDLNPAMMEFQFNAIRGIKAREDWALLSYPPGSGKGVIGPSWLKTLRYEKPALIVVPSFLKTQWVREMAKWAGEDVQVLNGRTPYALQDRHYVINYEILPYWANALAGRFETAMADESHNLADLNNKRTDAFFWLHKKAKNLLLMTGTPLLSRLDQLYPTCKMLAPKVFDSVTWYRNRYCDPKKDMRGSWVYKGARHVEELHELLKPYMIRETKATLMPWLPKKNRFMVHVPVPKDLESRYLAVKNEFRDDAQGLKAQLAMAELSCTAYFEKQSFVHQYIADMLEEGTEKMIVGAFHTRVIDDLANKFKGFLVIDGRVGVEKRQPIVDAFQNDPSVQGIILQANSAVGFTLDKAHDMTIVEPVWSPLVLEQLEDRCILGGSLLYCTQSATVGGKGPAMSIKTIEDLSFGDRVLTHTGQMQRIVDKWESTSEKPITTLRYSGWYHPLETTYDHRILVQRDGIPQWVEAGSVVIGDLMLMPRPPEGPEFTVLPFREEWRKPRRVPADHCIEEGCTAPILARNFCRQHYRARLETRDFPNVKRAGIQVRMPVMPKEIQITDEWIYAFGFYMAEGFVRESTTKGSQFVGVAGHKTERNILENIQKLFAGLGVNSTIYTRPDSNGIEMRAYSADLALWFGEWFGRTGQRYRKFPQELMNMSRRQTAILLDAYIEGDGYYRKNKKFIEWITVSPDLAYQLSYLVAKLGWDPNLRVIPPSADGKRQAQYIGGYTPNGRRPSFANGYVGHRINSVATVEATEPYKVYDLTVENDSSFMVGHSIVHNCHRINTDVNAQINYYYIIADGTIEEKMFEVVDRKNQNFSGVLDGEVKSYFEGVKHIYLNK